MSGEVRKVKPITDCTVASVFFTRCVQFADHERLALLGHLAVVNVDHGADIAEEGPILVMPRRCGVDSPSVRAIRSSKAILDVEGRLTRIGL